MITYPDAPINFQEDLSQRTESTIGLQWTEDSSNGGTVVTNFIVSQMDNLGVYQVVDSTITQNSYIVTGLTYGETYKFKVQAQNSFDIGEYSSELELLSATVPEAPETPVTSTSTNQLVVTWVAPNPRGTPITGYKIYIRQSDLTYTQESVSCEGDSPAVISAQSCNIPLLTI